jgi:hypothetical protein
MAFCFFHELYFYIPYILRSTHLEPVLLPHHKVLHRLGNPHGGGVVTVPVRKMP